ncbi:TonB-dependent receptor domain-containing protein [Novosphingobium sp. B 225]|uniref:TonB-dependent receptor domain-containing protein n=1 Tax=Novosphingobium sp. B 225 TaxID=1961849 RepID=UPI000B4A7900|nr:TonB-dependent receptor [Novosphingobium sp. B 225]
MRSLFIIGGLTGLTLAMTPHAALAQRASENATTQSSDAFGRSVGSEKTGLYNSEDVRGFNPVDAGNVRLEGLYFDQVDRISSRLVDGNTIRVGPATLRYPFPAPTGLVDYSLTQPHGKPIYSLNLEQGSSNARGMGGSFEFKQPFDGERLGLSGGFGWRNAQRFEGGQSRYRTVGATLAWRPSPDTQVLLFGGDFIYRSDEAVPVYFPAGTALPPKLKRGENHAQDWTSRSQDLWTAGAVIKAPLGGLRAEAGLFYSLRDQHSVFADIMAGVQHDGTVASHRIVADADSRDGSLSGEMRLVKRWTSGSISQQLTASLRGRARDRRFGGAQTVLLGPSTVLAPDPRPEPVITIGPKNQDRVRQLTYGLAWSLVSAHGFSFDAGVSTSNYRKAIDFANPALADPITRDHPLLFNLGGSWNPAHSLMIYAGVSHGQEEALIAPDIATNRAEAPAAIHTRQIEAGIKYSVTPRLTLIAGLFKITKPYFNLDPALRYRKLGKLRNQGIELSLTGQLAPGLTLVGGTMLLDPRISGEAVEAKLIGVRPVGQIRRRSAANLDWRLDHGKSPLSFDLALESLSGRVGNSANTLYAPARATVNLGARYRFKAAGADWLLRPVLLNAFNNYGWQVSTSGGFTYTTPRTLTLQLAADF